MVCSCVSENAIAPAFQLPIADYASYYSHHATQTGIHVALSVTIVPGLPMSSTPSTASPSQVDIRQRWLSWQATRNAMLDLPDVPQRASTPQHRRHASEASSNAWAGLRTASNGTTSSCTALSTCGDDARNHDGGIKSVAPPHVAAVPMFNAFGGAMPPAAAAATTPAAMTPATTDTHTAALLEELRALAIELRHSTAVQTQLLEALVVAITHTP